MVGALQTVIILSEKGYDMNITILGYLLLPVGLVLLLGKQSNLLKAAILTCGMTGASLINFGDTALQPSYYFALLWMISYIFNGGHLRIRSRIRLEKCQWYLLGFVAVAVVSIIVPVLFKNRVEVMNVDGKIVPLGFTSANITQLIYLLFIVAFFFLLCSYLNEDKRCEELYNWYIGGILLVIVITIYQILAYSLNIPYDVIFRMGVHNRDKTQLIFWDKRISGPCLEASMLGYYLVPSIAICFHSIKPYRKYMMTGLLLIFGVLSGSSTFFVGVALWVLLEFVERMLKNNTRTNIRTMTVIGACVAVVFLLFITGRFNGIILKVSFLINSFVEKLHIQNLSGTERIGAFLLLFNAFLHFPIIGVGFGSSRGKDLLSTWLANTGILGMSFLFMFLTKVISMAKEHVEIRQAIILVWACMFVSVAEPYNLFIWVLMALGVRYKALA